MPVGKKGSGRWWPRDVRVELERRHELWSVRLTPESGHSCVAHDGRLVAHWAKQIKESRPPKIISNSYRFRCESEASFFRRACWNIFLVRISSNRFIGAFRSRLHTGWRFPLGAGRRRATTRPGIDWSCFPLRLRDAPAGIGVGRRITRVRLGKGR